ncbi:MAG: S1 RNA-binding domain-containing protein [Candidatus Binatia bacterium]|nr:S1 RNA-binding domain-containing protein [Candidatus Binatia bacterium]
MSENDDPSMLDDDFSKLFEESLKSVKPGEVVTGEVVQVLNGFVTVDIGYKSEGQVPIAEFRDREGNAEVEVGSQIEVFFEGSDGETGIEAFPDQG